jgi:cytochrome c-type protein NapB
MSRGRQVLFVVVLSAAVIGFVVGIDDGVPRGGVPDDNVVQRTAPDAEETGGDVAMPATTYLELHRERIGANAAFRNSVEDLAAAPPPPETAPGGPEKRAALVDRAERRAYNGAPPTIPHAVEPVGSDACLGCHAVGAQVDGQSADRLPHLYLTACQQCHVAVEAPFEPTLVVSNSFVGVPAPFEGARAWTGAPPTVPHSTLMREECDSCHGLHGKPGLRTSHPERASCTQCHAPSAALDQLAFGAPGFVDGPAVLRDSR